MSRNISLFSGYSQRENRTTNYCLLVLKLLYEENPKYLAEALSMIFGEEIGDYVGVQFRQQEKRTKSVPDGLICQRSFTIYIETKNFDWFHDDQIGRHLEALNEEAPGLKILLALGNFESQSETRFETVQNLCETAYHNSVVFKSASFEDFIEAIEDRDLPKNLADTVADFRAYLDSEHLLPSWKYRLDVVNCAGNTDEPLKGQVYICPSKGGAYNHKQSQFFGMYKDKCVRQIALIEAVVNIESGAEASVQWKHVSTIDEGLVSQAREKLDRWRKGSYPSRVFLLGPLYPTTFWKDTTRGMQGSKQYFWVNAESAEDLASQLKDKEWSRWRESK